MTKTGGDAFDPKDRQLYFIAINADKLLRVENLNRHLLCAVNEINGDAQLDILRGMMKRGTRIFIDSGIFNLTMEHARKHDCHMNEALGLAPDEIDGFDNLFDRYVEVCGKIGGDSWGYIEIDQGGRENKIKTRAKLEKLGLRPVPVYHPLNDGWDYFDYLATRYDRICFGNVVQAEIAERQRLISTAFIRQKKYPKLWIHLLGVTPSELLHSCPSCSCDSSTWLSSMRWGFSDATCFGKRVAGGFGPQLTYRYGAAAQEENPDRNASYIKGEKLFAYDAEIMGRNWQAYVHDYTSAQGASVPKRL
jgi:hypothetical protein